MRVSYSAIRMFRDCPWAWRQRYVLGVPGEVVPEFQRGRRFHEAIEAYARHCRAEGRERDLDWARAHAEAEEDPDLALALANYALLMAFNWDMAAVVGEAVERWFEVPLGDRHTLAGRVDFVLYNEPEDEVWLYDAKLGLRRYDPDRPPRQLLLYAYWAWREYGVPRVQACVVQPLLPRTWTWEVTAPVEVDWAMQAADEMEKAAESGDCPARPGRCEVCPYILRCPLVAPEGDWREALRRIAEVEGNRLADDYLGCGRDTVDGWISGELPEPEGEVRARLADALAGYYLDTIRSERAAVLVAERYLAVEALRRRLQQRLRKWVEARGNIDMPEGRLGLLPPVWAEQGMPRWQVREGCDEALRTLLAQRGYNLERFGRARWEWNEAALNELVNQVLGENTGPGAEFFGGGPEEAEMAEALRGLVEPRPYSLAFGFRKRPRERGTTHGGDDR